MEKVLTYSRTVKDYIILTKPGIVIMAVMTTMTGIYMANRGLPPSSLSFWTLLGTGFAAAGATVLNNFYDRDIDVLMERTSSRPLPQGAIKPSSAFATGTFFIAASFVILAYFVNLLTALLGIAAAFVYVVVYTGLKRITPNATVIGGISGALPPVIGYSAITGTVGQEAFILFLIMFIWQPAHFWFLAIKYTDDYRNANIPTLPVSKGLLETKTKIIMFNLALFPVSLLPWFYDLAGMAYLVTAVFLGLTYLFLSARLLFTKGGKNVIYFFYFSILYLVILFMVMGIDLQPL